MLAYLDPGTGSLIIQLIIAILFSTGIALRRYLIDPIARLFRRGKPSEEPEQQAEPDA